ncbi:hypothetical protein BDV59DRAFT_202256 [Aspergillus ambiguus]|uniref:uncharacterized protein n=1 Tax=Aspergillus ambiguus TaxID=176160 RepID=UPI003CCCE6C9
MKPMLITDSLPDERLMRNELLALVKVIGTRLNPKHRRDHLDVPVLLYSFADTSVRMLEANFNGNNLVVRDTKYYDFIEEDTESLPLTYLFVRWWFGHPSDEDTTGGKSMSVSAVKST